ncbi:MAG: efflux RND transporter permease subunit [Candidatus Eremiobacteraeota bacterium]|nr:efflux RND transporter permease subunit [Candidatus Eremiobacteraeota bacterium]
MGKNFFIQRPIFAAVCAAMILLFGLVAMPTLPIAYYPKIAPPVVTVTANYIGANAQTVESSVTTPLEQAINGVQGLRYITSTSDNTGTSTITCTFDLGRDLDQATNDVQNAIQSAQGILPNEVKQTGVVVSKNSGTFTMAIGMTSTNPQYGSLWMSNYVDRRLVNVLKRLQGISDVFVFGERKYAMRVWLDPLKLNQNSVTAADVVAAIQAQNVQVAAGAIGAQPAPKNQPYQITVNAVGRLSTPEQFENIILRANPDGGFVRLGDVGHVDLGAQDYSVDLAYARKDTDHGKPRTAIGLGILQLSSANALQLSKGVRAAMEDLSKEFPPGVKYSVAFDTTDFVNESIREVIKTLVIAIILVVLVIFLFLQDWRTTLIPAITIPISLIGTFGLMKILGFSINTLTMFGMTLATGLVVDDAIVVIENISRYIEEKKEKPLPGAILAMKEITGAVIATSLVLLSVFVPVAFFPGTTGQLYKQFALTIACSISISAFIALTLTPALSALFITGQRTVRFRFFKRINAAIAWMRREYHELLPHLISARVLVVGGFLAGLGILLWMYTSTPSAFIQNEDQGYFITVIQLPEGSSLDQTVAVTRRVTAMTMAMPEVRANFAVAGFTFGGSTPSRGLMFTQLKPWSERGGSDHTLDSVLGRLQPQLFTIPNAQVFAFNPPAVQGVGNFGGFQFEVEDIGDVGLPALMQAGFGYMGLGNQDPALANVFTTFRINSPQLQMDVDRDRAQAVHVALPDIFSTLSVFLGSSYVNDFTYQNRSYRVYVQAAAPYRARVADLDAMYVRNASGAMMPLTQLVTQSRQITAPIINHYNLFRSLEINGTNSPGHGSGQAMAAMENIAKKVDPPGVGYEWSGLSLDEKQSGGTAAIIFLLGIIVTYLVLSAKYESFTDPFVVLLAVPLALLGALVAINARVPFDAFFAAGGFWKPLDALKAFFFTAVTFQRGQVDVFSQVGFVMLVGLASKNGILIVEFANQLREQGNDIVTAVRRAAETRLRPILMTSIAFTLGVVPLVIATGAGSVTRHSLGTTVFGGMIVSTILNLAIIPVFYVIIETLKERRSGRKGPPASRDGNGLAGPLSQEPLPSER